MKRTDRTQTTDGYAASDRVVRQFPGMEAKEGTVVRVDGDEIVVSWDWGGYPQVLPLDQRRYIKMAPR